MLLIITGILNTMGLVVDSLHPQSCSPPVLPLCCLPSAFSVTSQEKAMHAAAT